MTLTSLIYDLTLMSRCSIADVTPEWCAEAAKTLEPLKQIEDLQKALQEIAANKFETAGYIARAALEKTT